MLLDLRHINFEDERNDPLLAQEANEAAVDLADENPMKGLSINDIPEQYRKGVQAIVRDMVVPTPAQEQAMQELGLIDPRAADLTRWERKALKSLKRFHTAAVKFESDAIPAVEQARIREALESATTADEVKAAFKADVVDAEWDAAMEWAEQVVD